MSISQLSEELDLNKTTVYRLLTAMRKFDFIDKNPANEKYRLGLKLHELGCRALETRTLWGEAHTFLVEMSRRCTESVSIAVLSAERITCLDRVDSVDSVIATRTPVGGRFHPHCTAAGKAILAYLPTPEVWAIVKRNGMPLFTSATMVKYKDLFYDLDVTRRRGYATDNGELERGLSGLAAPIFMRGTRVTAAVGMAGPTQRFQGEDLAPKVALVRDFAARISRAFGRRESELPAPTRSKTHDPVS